MKQTDNDKMDLLLRGLAKRERAGAALPGASEAGSPSGQPAWDGEDQSHTAHLDADELSSYAERALPDVTHARYTAHLADCTRCRKIVTELTLASGASLADSRLEKPASATLWEKFIAFFPLPVLRYAVPALALFAVIAVAFIALRLGQKASFIAQNQELPEPASVAQTRETSAQVGQAETPAPAMLNKQPNESVSISGTLDDKKNKQSAKEEVAQGVVAANSVSLDAAKDSPTAKPTDAAAQPAFAPEPPPPPVSRDQAKSADTIRTDEAKRQDYLAERDAAAGQKEDQVRASDKAEQNAAAPQSQAGTLATRRVRPLSTGEVGAGAARRQEGEGATTAAGNEDVRTVAGRRFRRQGQTWVDTAYDPSRSAIAVVRGSEQYRALIADEPGIRTFAEQLQGEVVLVWKGRTYRIR